MSTDSATADEINMIDAINSINTIDPTRTTSATNVIMMMTATKNMTITVMIDATVANNLNTTIYPMMKYTAAFPVTYPNTDFPSSPPSPLTPTISEYERKGRDKGKGGGDVRIILDPVVIVLVLSEGGPPLLERLLYW